MPAEAPARIEVFGFDVSEATQIRRIRALIALGHDVHSFTMRRENMNAGFRPDWPDTPLFRTRNQNLPARCAVIAASIVRMAAHRQRLREADLIIARNLDMLAIALAARTMAGAAQVPVIYECLDIHSALTRPDAAGAMLRAAERAMLARVQMLAVSSPGFVHRYFAPLQRYRGPWTLWENKLVPTPTLPRPPRHDMGRTLRLGWTGTIRCAPSLALLADTAARMGDRLEVHIHGVVHRHALPDFDRTLARHPTIHYHGPFTYPHDLDRIFGDCDLVWSQDLWQAGGNSDWLLPNRIYEAGWAGRPCIAVAGTETGRRIEQDGLGWVIPAARPECLADLLTRLTPAMIADKAAAIAARPATDFVQTPEDLSPALHQLRTAA